MISSQYCSFFFSSNLVLQLELTNTCAYSCHKRVQYGSVVSHIIGDIHLTGQGGLVVNGLDIVKYIRGLERRVSDLEKKFEAATLTENEDTLV